MYNKDNTIMENKKIFLYFFGGGCSVMVREIFVTMPPTQLVDVMCVGTKGGPITKKTPVIIADWGIPRNKS